MITEITSPQPEHLPRLRAIWKQAFGDSDAFLDLFFSRGFSFNRCLCALKEGIPVSAIYWFYAAVRGQKVAYLYALATDAAFQGRGIARQLLGRTEQHLQALGCSGALLVPGSDSLAGWYEGQGYAFCGSMTELTGKAAGAPAVLRSLTAAEYASAREALLPAGSVIQDLTALEFLETQAGLYGGKGFLLAAATDKDGNLFAPEFLGDPAAIPGILTALGCQKGVLRTPGGEKKPVMLKALSLPGMDMPDYFAFDFA